MPNTYAWTLSNWAATASNVTANSFVVSTNGQDRMYVNQNGNLVVGNSVASAQMQSSNATATASPTLGNPSGGALLLTNTNTAYGWLFGVAATGRGWAQVQRVDGTATAYDMLLQPTNGNVAIGSGTGAYTRLTVAKDANASFTGLGLGHAILSDSSAILNGYTNLDFTTGNQQWPIARIGMQYTVSGSTLSFGTSNNYASGVTNTAMTIDPSGNMGLGTTSPSARLHVQQATGSLIGYFNSTAASVNARVRINSADTASSVAYTLSYSDASLNKQASVYLTGTGALAWMMGQTAGSESTSGTLGLWMDPNGNIAINGNTVNPGHKLNVVAGTINMCDVASNTRLYMGFGTIPGGGSGAYIYNADNSTLAFGTTNAQRMGIAANGNVTIANNLSITAQPMISAKHTSTETPGAGGTFTGWTTVVNQGSGNFASGVYTVPIAGRYLITCSLLRNTGGSAGGVQLNVNGSNIYRMFYVDGAGTTGYAMGSGSIIYSCNANDTIRFTAETANAWYGDATGLGSFTINLLG